MCIRDRYTTESSARLWRYFMAARLLVALGLLAWLAWAQAQGQAPLWLLLLCAAYLASTAAVLRWSHPAQADSFWAPGWLPTQAVLLWRKRCPPAT